MASATREKEKAMATDAVADGADERGEEKPRPQQQPPHSQPSRDDGGGFFHIYKKGQGYWTRMGTAGAAALIAALTASFLYQHLADWIGASGVTPARAGHISLAIIGAFVLAFALLVYWVMNKPTNADFLIATDSEMKKVNWTSRKELIGSTKVVIFFMFLIALLLFQFDLIFGEIFNYIGVLKTGPLPTSDDMRWVRWAFWGVVAVEVVGGLLFARSARADRR